MKKYYGAILFGSLKIRAKSERKQLKGTEGVTYFFYKLNISSLSIQPDTDTWYNI